MSGGLSNFFDETEDSRQCIVCFAADRTRTVGSLYFRLV